MASQGFCCPSPSELRPVCPVGEAHESSSYPDYGCNECPNDYYCHRDGIITEKSVINKKDIGYFCEDMLPKTLYIFGRYLLRRAVLFHSLLWRQLHGNLF